MKKYALIVMLMLASMGFKASSVSINVIDRATFYDGYLVDKVPLSAPFEGYYRPYTFLNSTKLTDEQLDQIGETLTIDVTLFPLCDNYDRIASVNLAIVPKDSIIYDIKYDSTDPMRLELGRFITPFMDKNKEPGQVPYQFVVNNVSNILRDKDLRENYNFWLELMVFGVPYAAHTQIAGCAGCQDVFRGSVDLVTDSVAAPLVDTNVLVPITIRTADYRADRGMNNYNESCTDTLGMTIKTFKFTVPEDCADSRLVLVMSNHGAGTNGEEYVRRMHYVYVDDELALTFKPGRQSCEPFRKFNTQANGIYGYRPKTDEQWQSFSNWCPGDVIDNRTIELGAFSAGEHTVTIDVPDAMFYGKDGYFPVSLYFQGDTKDTLPGAGVEGVACDDYRSAVTVIDGNLIATCPDGIEAVEIYNIKGEMLRVTPAEAGATTLSLPVYNLNHADLYIAVVKTHSGSEAHKFRP